MDRIGAFVAELFRRKVVRVLCGYIVILWLVAQGFAALFPVLGIPSWILRSVIVTGIALAPLVAYLSWRYDIVPPQLVRDSHDIATENPALKWALVRHDGRNVGQIYLKWTNSSDDPKEAYFYRPVTIGREPDNDIKLVDERVSRHHAVLWAERDAWHIRDLNTPNGTYVDDSRVSGITELPQICTLRCHSAGPRIEVVIATSAETVVD